MNQDVLVGLVLGALYLSVVLGGLFAVAYWLDHRNSGV